MSFLIAATFKSNKTAAEVKSWVQKVAPVAQKSSAEVIAAPSFPHLSLFAGSLKLAAQDVSPFPPGSYTGAVNASQLLDLGVKYCLVGHSERRRYFHETHSDIANKITELLAVGITPILCLSEDDIFPQLAAIPGELKTRIMYCYEPPADIGGTDTAPVAEISPVVELLRQHVDGAPVMYGGSVNADNIISLLDLDLSGVLVSTASLEAESFVSLINSYTNHRNI